MPTGAVEVVELRGKGEQGDNGENRKLVEPVGKGSQWENENKGKDGKPGEQGEYGEKRYMTVGRKEGQELGTGVTSKLAGQLKVGGAGPGLGSQGEQIKKASGVDGSGSKAKPGVDEKENGEGNKEVGTVRYSSSKTGARPAALVQKIESSSNMSETASGEEKTAGSSCVLVVITLCFARLKD